MALELIDLLVAFGARFDLGSPETLYAPLLNEPAMMAHALAKWNGTAAGWAEAGGHPEIAALLSSTARP